MVDVIVGSSSREGIGPGILKNICAAGSIAKTVRIAAEIRICDICVRTTLAIIDRAIRDRRKWVSSYRSMEYYPNDRV